MEQISVEQQHKTKQSLKITSPIIVIPAYQPGETLIQLIDSLQQQLPFIKIVIVNDGSSPDKSKFFDLIRNHPACTLLTHTKNQGKGQALKTAFNYIVKNYPHCCGIVTADADGQHLSEDIQKVLETLILHPSQLILGCRKFSKKIPFRSLLGNMFTRKLFSFMHGIKISDTQTGLRGIPLNLAKACISIKSDGYEFELNMLLAAKKQKITIRETAIKTVYIENNQSSHFKPLKDSLKIYYVLFRFSLSSFATATLDALVFFAVYYLSHNILLSLIAGRIVAGTENFLVNKSLVFHSKSNFIKEAIPFIFLVAALMCVSYVFILMFSALYQVHMLLAKISAESLVFIINFFIQRNFVFLHKI